MQLLNTTWFFWSVSILFGLPLFAYAEQSDHDRRYLNEVFSDYTRTGDVVYGRRFNPTSGQLEKLTMRIFEPKGDDESHRPLFVLTPGGGFVAHEDDWMDEFGAKMAKAGYVVAINRYRLSNSIESPNLYFEALFKAVSDQKAAIQFLVNDARRANHFRIDPNNIFIGGHSAGAITSLHSAYLDAEDEMPEVMVNALKRNGGWSLLRGNQHPRHRIRGVINLSGLVTDLYMLDNDEPPLFSAHGDKDGVVQIGTSDDGAVFGSLPIHEHAEAIGLPNELNIIRDGLHNDTSDPGLCPECVPLVRRFMFNRISRSAASY